MTKLRETYAFAPKAIAFVNTIYEAREQVCSTFTSKHFTVGHTSSQRGESWNSTVKGHGVDNKTLRNYSIYELMKRLQLNEEKHMMESIEELKLLIKDGKFCSKFVFDRWKKSMDLSLHYISTPIEAVEPNGISRFKVVRRGTDTFCHEAIVSVDLTTHPTCTCGNFTSSLIPHSVRGYLCDVCATHIDCQH